jgi:short-subunit dehydrogenase
MQETVIITGAASGVGRRMTERSVAAGRQVAAIDVNAAGLATFAAASPLIRPYNCDLSNGEDVINVVDRISCECGPVIRLVHAAALMPAGSIVSTPAAQIARLMEVNYAGTVHITKAVLPAMIERGAGEVVVFGSIAGAVLTHGMAPYAASKAAVAAYVEILMHELEGSGLNILLVCPPIIDTPLLSQLGGNGPEMVAGRIRQGQMLTCDEVIDALERGLTKKMGILYPGSAWVAQLARRLAPRLLWRSIDRLNRAGSAQ